MRNAAASARDADPRTAVRGAAVDPTDSTLIDGFYAAALDADLWPGILERLAEAFGGRQATLYAHDLRHRGSDIQAQWGVEAGFARSYVAHFGQVNPFVAGVARLAVGVSAAAEDLVAARLYTESEFFHDWVRPQGCREFLTTTLVRDGGAVTGITVLRGTRAFSTEERRRWDLLTPHATRAMQVHRQLHRARLLRDGALQALEALSVGAILVDERPRVLFANRWAERCCGRGRGLDIRQGWLRGDTPAATERLAVTVRAAIASAAEPVPRRGAVLVMPRAAGAGLPVLVSPLQAGIPAGIDRPVALVLVGGPRGLRARREDVARTFGLTPAEAGVLVGLVDGRSLSDYAATAGIAVETARKHLRHVLAKTGTVRQSDAIRRVLEDLVLTAASPSTSVLDAGDADG